MTRALVTGAAGFVGSHLVERLTADGVAVDGVDDLSGAVEWPAVAACASALVEARVGDPAARERTVELVAAADVVFHLASPIGVEHTHRHPAEVSASILESGAAIVDACARTSTPLVFTSSSEAYGVQGAAHLDEALVPRFDDSPRWAYGSAKLAVEEQAFEASARYGFPTWVARLFNVVGAGQRPSTGLVVPTFCAAALDGMPIRVHGDGSSVRSFVDVHDLVDGLVRLAATPDLAGAPVNLGGDRQASVNEVASLVQKLVGDVPIVREDPAVRHRGGFTVVARRVPDLSTARDHLSWSPTIGLEQSITECAASIDAAPQERAG